MMMVVFDVVFFNIFQGLVIFIDGWVCEVIILIDSDGDIIKVLGDVVVCVVQMLFGDWLIIDFDVFELMEMN